MGVISVKATIYDEYRATLQCPYKNEGEAEGDTRMISSSCS
jgi:hypothetical protein